MNSGKTTATLSLSCGEGGASLLLRPEASESIEEETTATQGAPPRKRKETPRKTPAQTTPQQETQRTPSLRIIGDYRLKYRERQSVPLDTSLVNCKDLKIQVRLQTVYAVRGRLKHFWTKWAEMEASRRVVRWLKFGMPLSFNRKVMRERGRQKLTVVSPSLGSVLSRSGQTGRVRCNGRSASSKTMHSRDVSHIVRFFFSRVFLVPKRNTSD